MKNDQENRPHDFLDCTLTTDPDGHTVKSYKDVFGNVVLERRADNYDTYYVYDNLNRLRFVLPPNYQQQANLGYYAYQYQYDGRGNLVKKTLPGCSPIQYWYDGKDRCVKMQDGVLAQSGKYRVWTYDGLDRVVSQAIEGPGNQHQNEILNFYDNYDFLTSYSSLFPTSVNSLIAANTLYAKGQQTGSWQQANDGGAVISVMGYDAMGYPAKSIMLNPGRCCTISALTNNLAGNVTEEDFTIYARPNMGGALSEAVHGTIVNNYDYPHTNLLTSSVITIYDKNGNMRNDTIQHLTYDGFGNIASNNRSGNAADMTYSYDQMHGWLTGIQSSTGFEQRLYRETEGNVPCYSGNISAMTWKTNNTYLRRFDYRYNGMNWLKNADFSYYTISGVAGQSPTLSLVPYVGVDHEDYTCEYYYDKNGNITGAYRQGLVDNLEYEYGLSYDTMDDYNVEYHGNQKTAVNGSGTGTPSYYGSSSFVDGVENGSNEYAYDANGAMTKDLNKGISSISYDLLGNLKTITQTENRSISYVYSADGTRLKTVHSKKVGSAYVKDSTEYCGSLVLKNGKPGMFLFPGGYYSFNTSGLLNSCHYYIQDYLGSNRMVVNKSGAVEQITHYYPYGGVIGGIDNTPNLQPYKFEGMEFDRTYGLDWYDIHARQYDPVVPSWHKMDPLAEKYYWLSPYAYCGNNPVNAVDYNGQKSYLIVWKTGKNHYGHAAFAVDNYKLRKSVVNGVNTTLFQPDGTVTLYGLFPANAYGEKDFRSNKMERGLFLVNRRTTLEKIQNTPLRSGTGEDYSPEGIIQINSSYKQDQEAKKTMELEMQSNKHYRGQTRNCSTFAKEGVKAASGQEVDGSIMWVDTPNALFQDTKKLDVNILKDEMYDDEIRN